MMGHPEVLFGTRENDANEWEERELDLELGEYGDAARHLDDYGRLAVDEELDPRAPGRRRVWERFARDSRQAAALASVMQAAMGPGKRSLVVTEAVAKSQNARVADALHAMAQDPSFDEWRLADETELRRVLGNRPTFAPWDERAPERGRRRASYDFVVWLAGRSPAEVAQKLSALFAARRDDLEYQLAMVANLVAAKKLFRVLDAGGAEALWNVVLEARRRGVFQRMEAERRKSERARRAAPRKETPPELRPHIERVEADVARLHALARRIEAHNARTEAPAPAPEATFTDRLQEVGRTAAHVALDLAEGTVVERAGKRALGLLDGLSGGAATRWASRAQRWIGDRRVMKSAEASAPGRVSEDALASLDPEGGMPLPPEVVARLRAVFQHDFSHVRVHTGPGAARAAAGLGARAVTVGSHIFFNEGQYQPGTPTGDQLLIHELTHVVQHDEGRLPKNNNGRLQVSRPEDESEREASAMESRASAMPAAGAAPAGAAPAGHSARTEPARDARAAEAREPRAVDSREARADSRDAGQRERAPEMGGQASRGLLADGLAAIVRRVSPGLADLIKKGPGEMIKQAIEPAVKSWISGLTRGLDLGGIVNNLANSFKSAFAVLQGAKDNDPKCCELLVNAINAVRKIAESFMNNPVITTLKTTIGKVNDTIKKVAKLILEPAFNVLKTVVGGVWDAISSVASTIWGWMKAVKDYAGSAFDWVLEKLGISGGSEGGVLDWLKGKASAVWDTIKQTLKPAIGPLTKVLGVLGMFTGLTQIYLIVKYGPKVVQAVQWLWANRNDPNIVKKAHKEMGGTILPQLLEGIQGFASTIKSAVTGFLSQIRQVGESVLELAGAISGIPLLSMAKGFVDNVSKAIQKGIDWVGGALTNAGQWIGQLATKVANFVKPYMEVLTSVAMAVANPPMIPVIVGGWAWRWLPDCIKPPLIDLLLDGLIVFMQALPDFPMLGLLWPLVKSGVIGFMQGLRSRDDATKIKVSNKVAKIISGASPAFLLGLVKGILLGIWDGIKDPFELIWLLAKGLVAVIDYFNALAADAAKPRAPAATTPATAPTPAPTTPAPTATPSTGATNGATTPAPAPAPANAAPVGVPQDFNPDHFDVIAAGVTSALISRKPRPTAPGSTTGTNGASTTAPSTTTPSRTTTPTTPATPAPAATPAAPVSDAGNVAAMAEVAATAGKVAGELKGPVDIITQNFWPAVKELFSGGEGMTFDQFIAKLGEIWDAAKGIVASAGNKLAVMICDFFMKDSAEGALGEAVGYVIGMILFEIVIEYLSAGTWRGAMGVLSMIAKFLNWPSKFLGEAMKLIGKLGGYIIQGVRKLASLAKRATGGALKAVMNAFEQIGEKLMKYADELLGKAGKVADNKVDDAAGAAAGKADNAAGKVDDVAEGAAKKGDGAADNAANKADNADDAKKADNADDAKKKKDGELDDAARKKALKELELAEAIAAIQALKAAAQVNHVPAVAVAPGLMVLKTRYEWIDRFEMEHASGPMWSLILFASQHPMGPYKDMTRIPKGCVHPDDAPPAAKALMPDDVKARPNDFYYDPNHNMFIERPKADLPSGASTATKGDFGEERMQAFMDAKYGKDNFLGTSHAPATGVGGKPQGIDGIYKNPSPPPPIIVVEAKFNKSTMGTTADGKQMSDTWIAARLEQILGKTEADKILALPPGQQWQKVGVRIMPDGTIKEFPIGW